VTGSYRMLAAIMRQPIAFVLTDP